MATTTKTSTPTVADALYNGSTIRFASRKITMVDYTGATTTVRRIDAHTISVNGETEGTDTGATAIDLARTALRDRALASRREQARNIVEFAETAGSLPLNTIVREAYALAAVFCDKLDDEPAGRSTYTQRMLERAETRAKTAAEMLIAVVVAVTGQEDVPTVPADAVFTELFQRAAEAARTR